MPEARLEPADAESAAAMLADAAADGRTLTIEGGRTKLGPATQVQATMSSQRLTGGLAHYAGDLVATVTAGASLMDVNAALAAERQWLPLDPPRPDRATIGGIVASNDSGPRRHRYGSPRDLIIGIEVALPNGRVVHGGGRVVKNVAGYDLARLFCGSHGSLGMITSATFKLAPLPAASRTVMARFATARQAAASALALAAAPLTPSTIEIAAPEPRLLVRFETTVRSAGHMAEAATALLKPHGSVVILDGNEETDAWREHADLQSPDSTQTVRMSVLPTQVVSTLDAAGALIERTGLSWSLTGRVAMGVLLLHLQGDANAQIQFVASLRRALPTGAHVHVGGPAAGGPLAPAARWDDLGAADAIGLAVKQRFDPAAVLPYPWSRG